MRFLCCANRRCTQFGWRSVMAKRGAKTRPRRLCSLEVHHTWASTPFTCNFWPWSLVLQTCMDSAHLAQSHTQAINQSHPELPHPKKVLQVSSPPGRQSPCSLLCFAPTNHKIPCHDTTPSCNKSEGMADFKVPRARKEAVDLPSNIHFPTRIEAQTLPFKNSYPSIIATLTGCPGLLQFLFLS